MSFTEWAQRKIRRRNNEGFMKIFAALCFLVISASYASADNRPAQPEQWICYAQGKQNMGGPVGDIWQMTIGRGASQFEAFDRAQQNCFSQGLQMCTVTDCHQK